MLREAVTVCPGTIDSHLLHLRQVAAATQPVLRRDPDFRSTAQPTVEQRALPARAARPAVMAVQLVRDADTEAAIARQQRDPVANWAAAPSWPHGPSTATCSNAAC